MKSEIYLGDGAYARVLDYGVELYTTDGITTTNSIVLEPDVLVHFMVWVAQAQTP